MSSDRDYSEFFAGYTPPKRKITSGKNTELESIADAILADYRKDIRKHSEKQDYLSEHQLKKRMQKEIYVTSGFPDESLFSGIFKRAHNPDGGILSARSKKMRDTPWE